jgi:type I restriction enzyme S subunit
VIWKRRSGKNSERLDLSFELREVCEIVSEKTTVAKTSIDRYVSTESMLANKAGITTPASIPGCGNVSVFKKGDTLVSNIRPYFKKIWYADRDGECSNDVIVFRSNGTYDSRFLYYVLSDDAFFDHVMASSNGTKMPRGDKEAIMDYAAPRIPIDGQTRIANLLAEIDRLIRVNNLINDYLCPSEI